MPWCDDCARFWSPNTVGVDARCPTCHRPLAAPVAAPTAAAGAPERVNLREVAGESARAPWHFKLLAAAAVLYLVWRLVQLIVAVAT